MDKDTIFDYLDDLWQSGDTNMPFILLAYKCVMVEFELSEADARSWCAQWRAYKKQQAGSKK